MSVRVCVSMNRCVLAIVASAGLAAYVQAQTTCTLSSGTGPLSTGPDYVVGTINTPQNYAPTPGLEAFGVGYQPCNAGSSSLTFANGNPVRPGTAINLLKRKTVDGVTTVEQIGMSWVFREISTLATTVCCSICGSSGSSPTLLPGCASTNSGGLVASQIPLVPRWDVNASTGVFLSPATDPAFTGQQARRLQAAVADLEVAGGVANVGWFVETVSVSVEDATAGNALNNASYANANMTVSTGDWTLAVPGPTTRGARLGGAISVWQAADPGVDARTVDIPGDGRFVVASRAYPIPGPKWRYEYAVFNLNSDRSCGRFSVPVTRGATATAAGFHDVAYHSGDGPGGVTVSGTDWTPTIFTNFNGSISWATETFATNASANALRWGTTYNFRFESTAAPQTGQLTLGLFKPGTPTQVTVPGVVPVGTQLCAADFNTVGGVSVQDIFDFLAAWFAGDTRADFNTIGGVSVQDIFDFLGAWFQGC